MHFEFHKTILFRKIVFMFVMRSKNYIMPDLIHLLIWVLVGALAGFLAGLIVKGKGKGFLLNLLVGIAGAIIGGWLLGGLIPSVGNQWADLAIVATGGATILLFLIKLIFKK